MRRRWWWPSDSGAGCSSGWHLCPTLPALVLTQLAPFVSEEWYYMIAVLGARCERMRRVMYRQQQGACLKWRHEKESDQTGLGVGPTRRDRGRGPGARDTFLGSISIKSLPLLWRRVTCCFCCRAAGGCLCVDLHGRLLSPVAGSSGGWGTELRR